MPQLSSRHVPLSSRAEEQQELPFGTRFDEAKAIAESSPADYLRSEFVNDTNYDAVTDAMLRQLDTYTQTQLLREGLLNGPKFNFYNLQHAQRIIADPRKLNLLPNIYMWLDSIPQSVERDSLINEGLTALIALDVMDFWAAENQIGDSFEISLDVMDEAREAALNIAARDPDLYFFNQLHSIPAIYDITQDALHGLSREHPERYFGMLLEGDFEADHYSFHSAAMAYAKNHPKAFFDEVYEYKDVFDESQLTIPKEAIIMAGTWLAENSPEKYKELRLNEFPELANVSYQHGMFLPNELKAAGYIIETNPQKDSFMSVEKSEYSDLQRHPEAEGLERFDASLNWAIESPYRKTQKNISDYYADSIHNVGNLSSVKSFALVTPDIENQALLVEEIQSDYGSVLHDMRSKKDKSRLNSRGVGPEAYNKYLESMSEHLASYPYLIIQRMAEWAALNENIDTVKISSVSSVMEFAGLDERSAERVYGTIPKELGFVDSAAAKIDPTPTENLSKFINMKEPLSVGRRGELNESIKGLEVKELGVMFRHEKWPVGAQDALRLAAKRLAEEAPAHYARLKLYNIVEFAEFTNLVDMDKYHSPVMWTEYTGDMDKLAARAAAGAEKAIASMHEKTAPQVKKPMSKRDKDTRVLDIEALRPEVSHIIGDRSDQIEFSSDVTTFMRSVGKLYKSKVISKAEKNRLTGLIARYIKAFLDAAMIKIAAAIQPHDYITNENLKRIYELEYKLSELARRDELGDSGYLAKHKYSTELQGLLNKAIGSLAMALRSVLVVWQNSIPGFMGPKALRYMFGEDADIVTGMYEKAKNYLKEPTGLSDGIILFHSLLQTYHSSGKVSGDYMRIRRVNPQDDEREFMSAEEKYDFFDELSAGPDVDEWKTQVNKLSFRDNLIIKHM